MRTLCPEVTRAQPPALPRNSNGRLGFPGPTQEEARNPLRNSRIPPQLEKNHVFPTSSQDEALACYGVSRKEPRSVLKCETVLCTLDATPNVPGHAGLTRQEHRGSRTTSSEHLLPSCSRQEGLFPCFVWKGFPTFPAHLRMIKKKQKQKTKKENKRRGQERRKDLVEVIFPFY